jgi:hypothetical protein
VRRPSCQVSASARSFAANNIASLHPPQHVWVHAPGRNTEFQRFPLGTKKSGRFGNPACAPLAIAGALSPLLPQVAGSVQEQMAIVDVENSWANIEDVMPVLLLWAVPAVIVVGGVGYYFGSRCALTAN